MPFKILIVDDSIYDKTNSISELPNLLQAAGYEVVTTDDGKAAYDWVWDYNPDLIVLDIQFDKQDIDGIEICRAIREQGNQVPIILVTTVFKETKSVLRGFEVGADDYVKLPEDNQVILARVRANLPPEIVQVNNYIRIDFDRRLVWVKQKEAWQKIHLQRLEFELLLTLVLNAGLTMTSFTLKDRVWGKHVSDDVLRVYIRRLREKLESDPASPSYIETIHSEGYRFNGRPYPAKPPVERRCCRE